MAQRLSVYCSCRESDSQDPHHDHSSSRAFRASVLSKHLCSCAYMHADTQAYNTHREYYLLQAKESDLNVAFSQIPTEASNNPKVTKNLTHHWKLCWKSSTFLQITDEWWRAYIDKGMLAETQLCCLLQTLFSILAYFLIAYNSAFHAY